MLVLLAASFNSAVLSFVSSFSSVFASSSLVLTVVVSPLLQPPNNKTLVITVIPIKAIFLFINSPPQDDHRRKS